MNIKITKVGVFTCLFAIAFIFVIKLGIEPFIIDALGGVINKCN